VSSRFVARTQAAPVADEEPIQFRTLRPELLLSDSRISGWQLTDVTPGTNSVPDALFPLHRVAAAA
jgi:hypothetical protein